MQAKIILLPGDGIGPEVVAAAVRVSSGCGEKVWPFFPFLRNQLIGGCSIDASGVALTDSALKACQSADAVLLGAVGGPNGTILWPKNVPEKGLLALRKGLGVFANLRP
jgi:3-isopropylmalate dehydrogenase